MPLRVQSDAGPAADWPDGRSSDEGAERGVRDRECADWAAPEKEKKRMVRVEQLGRRPLAHGWQNFENGKITLVVCESFPWRFDKTGFCETPLKI